MTLFECGTIRALDTTLMKLCNSLFQYDHLLFYIVQIPFHTMINNERRKSILYIALFRPK